MIWDLLIVFGVVFLYITGFLIFNLDLDLLHLLHHMGLGDHEVQKANLLDSS
jgi:hypothetical protein